MPKIVPDIQNKILDVSERHFKDFGFEKTDMREIAAEAQVAVGTVYLHFQNKETLYHCVISHAWKKVTDKIEEISKKEGKPEQLLKEALFELVQTMIHRRPSPGLWTEIGFMHHDLVVNQVQKDGFPESHNSIPASFSSMIRQMAEENSIDLVDSICDQLGRAAFIMAADVCMQKGDNVEQDIDVIADMISAYIKNSINR